METQIKKVELVNDSIQLQKQVKEIVEKTPGRKRIFLENNERLKKLFVEDFVNSIREMERDGNSDYHVFMDFCYDLIHMIEGGRTLEINDEYGNRYEFVGHLTIPDWTGGLSRVCIDYTIPEMELDWLKKSKEFFQKRIDYWEQLDLEEDDLSRFYPIKINLSEENWFCDSIQFLYEILRNDITEKLTKVEEYQHQKI